MREVYHTIQSNMPVAAGTVTDYVVDVAIIPLVIAVYHRFGNREEQLTGDFPRIATVPFDGSWKVLGADSGNATANQYYRMFCIEGSMIAAPEGGLWSIDNGGGTGSGTYTWSGAIDEVYFWRGFAVPVAFILAYYNSGTGQSYNWGIQQK